ncbi:MAG: response regulator [Desulfurivibrionaceae bacterium]|jgi:DNA-binding NtrC family response regulator|nr:response regulator [Pseudomonadota bacterium]MCG2822422.1 response regulator [Desulfobulbaceae bacterium]MDP2002882.1 response regulator [Desulfurivibrionaceae bacterium]PKN20109.1 MAG: two-component system response regulator [Deltaproteobacteria bacterium HGW-Deltaproteobacteria-3]MBU4229849.1 response regulator [Pseudomonadota bacterium]
MSTKKGRVLYVDDEEINLVNFRETLCDEFEIFTAGSGKEALALLAREGEMALVVSDQRMPGMSGIELLTEIRAMCPDTIRMIISAYTEIHELIEAINKAEVYRYFVKPWKEDQLRLTIGNAVGTYALGQEIKQFVEQGRKQMAERMRSFEGEKG